MRTFEFKDQLENDPFVDNNQYEYRNLTESKVRLYPDSENLPYITKGYISYKDPKFLVYSEYYSQFRGRQLTTKKIKEIMDTSRYPLFIPLKDNTYYVGKGFVARRKIGARGEYELLFVACIDGRKPVPTNIADVKFFVSKNVYLEENKPILPAVKDFIIGHTGDIIMTKDVRKYIGEVIKIPTGGTIAQQKKYKEAVVMECLGDVLKAGK